MVAELRKVCSVFHPDVDAAKASLENVAGNMYESVCVPDLGDFLGYQSGGGGGHQVATPEHKSPATPASSATSNSSGPQNGGNQAGAPLQPPSASVSLPSRQYHNDGKSLSLCFSFCLFVCPPFLLHKNRTSKPLSVSLFSVCLYFDRRTRVYVSRKTIRVDTCVDVGIHGTLVPRYRLTLKKCWLYRKMYRCSRWTRGDKLERSRG